MSSDTNWPNPERPGYPSWPEHYGKHVLFNKETGDDVIGDWNKADDEWLLPDGSLKAKNAAKHYIYSHYASVELTPTQLTEMLAGEREKCLAACESAKVAVDGWGDPIDDGDADRNEGIDDAMAKIRNLGDAA